MRRHRKLEYSRKDGFVKTLVKLKDKTIVEALLGDFHLKVSLY